MMYQVFRPPIAPASWPAGDPCRSTRDSGRPPPARGG
jgi:hypothetical protein